MLTIANQTLARTMGIALPTSKRMASFAIALKDSVDSRVQVDVSPTVCFTFLSFSHVNNDSWFTVLKIFIYFEHVWERREEGGG